MSGFGSLSAKLDALAKVPALVVERASAEIKTSIEKEFQSGADPYGNRWVDKKRGGRSTLQSSYALSSSLVVVPNGTAIEISFSDYKFAFHQHKRPMLSLGVMPSSWQDSIERAFASLIKEG